MTKTILLATNGSLGDLFPYLALARSLKALGAHPIVASNPEHVRHIEAAGFEGHGVFPSNDEVAAGQGLDLAGLTARIQQEPMILFRAQMEFAKRSAERCLPLARRADVVSATFLAVGGCLAADQVGTPVIPAVFQPEGLAYWWMNDAARIAAIRAELGQAVDPPHPIARAIRSGAPILGMYSPVLGEPTIRTAPTFRITGAPVWEDDSAGPLDADVQAFLDNGPPPIVITMGSLLPDHVAWIYSESARLPDRLGERLVLIGAPQEMSRGDKVLARPYLPHGPVFARARAIVHHGGIGTSTAAVRAGKPQLVLPYAADTWENARRLKDLGISLSLPAKQFTLDRAEKVIRRLLNLQWAPRRAEVFAKRIAQEDGGGDAARVLLA